MIGVQLKLLLKSKQRIFLLLLMFLSGIAYNVYLFNYWGSDLSTWGANGFMFMQLKICYFYFVFMTMIAFDYFSERKDAKIEDIIVIQRRGLKTDIEMGCVLFAIPLVYQLCMTVFTVIALNYGKQITKDVILYVIKMWGCYAVLCGIMAIIFGCWIAKWKRKIIGYVCIVLFCLLTSFQMESGMMSNFGDGSTFGKLIRVLYVMPYVEIAEDGSVTSLGAAHFYPVHFFQWIPFLFWIGVFIFGVLVKSRLRFKKVFLVCCSLGVIICASSLCMFSPNEYMSTASLDDTSEWEMLGYYFSDSGNIEGKYEKAPYNILSYNLDITPGWQMNITAKMMLECQDVKEYKMTLYHLFKIKSIRDLDGNKLKYQRKGDYLTIESDKPLNGIVIEYYGGSPKYYCNRQNIALLGSYPYYPRTGFLPVFDLELQEETDCSLPDAVPFDVTVHSKQKVFCNLPEKELNHFVGETVAVNLISGFYESKIMDNGVTCVYSYLETYNNPELEDNKEKIDEVVDYMLQSGKWNDTKDKYLMISPIISIDKCTSDCIVTNQESWEGFYTLYCRNGKSLDEQEIKEKNFQFYFESRKMENDEETQDYSYSYDELKEYYNHIFNCYEGVTDEEFDSYIVQHFGEEQLKNRKGE